MKQRRCLGWRGKNLIIWWTFIRSMQMVKYVVPDLRVPLDLSIRLELTCECFKFWQFYEILTFRKLYCFTKKKISCSKSYFHLPVVSRGQQTLSGWRKRYKSHNRYRRTPQRNNYIPRIWSFAQMSIPNMKFRSNGLKNCRSNVYYFVAQTYYFFRSFVLRFRSNVQRRNESNVIKKNL